MHPTDTEEVHRPHRESTTPTFEGSLPLPRHEPRTGNPFTLDVGDIREAPLQEPPVAGHHGPAHGPEEAQHDEGDDGLDHEVGGDAREAEGEVHEAGGDDQEVEGEDHEAEEDVREAEGEGRHVDVTGGKETDTYHVGSESEAPSSAPSLGRIFSDKGPSNLLNLRSMMDGIRSSILSSFHRC